jgi:hypothetical protein
MGTTRASAAWSALGRAPSRIPLLLRLHRHRIEPEVSALVAFPSCRCGALLWPEGGGLPSAAPRVESEPPLS